MLKAQVAAVIAKKLDGMMSESEIVQLIEKPKHPERGDFALPCFTLAKKMKKAPQLIAKEITEKLDGLLFEKAMPSGGYVNLFLEKEQVSNQVLTRILQEKTEYGTVAGDRGTIVIDFSSPNIAKPFSMGHLRSTVIGNALANLAEKNGYDTVRVNHLGDWGTQFGKLITAFHLWGDLKAIESSPIQELLRVYVKFHEMAEKDETLNDKARAAFKALEDMDEQALSLWKWFREVSLKEFEKVYEVLGIHFDSYNGEAFYNDKMDAVVEELTKRDLLVHSERAYVVELDELPPCLIRKADGATLYATRDLAALFYRIQTYHPVKILYVVGHEQSLHFKQVFQVADKLELPLSAELVHVPFGMIRKDGKKMSTRKGKVVLLTDVLSEAVNAAQRNIEAKNPDLPEQEKTAKQVGVGAVIFNDLKNFRMNDIDFSLEQMVSFEGETGPYIQYTYARICSVLEKGEYTRQEIVFESLGEYAWPVIQILAEFPETVVSAFDEADPSQLAKYALHLARAFNKFYAQEKILKMDSRKQQRLAFAHAVAIVLKESLRLLGMEAPENM